MNDLLQRLTDKYQWLVATPGAKASMRLTKEDLVDLICAIQYAKAVKNVAEMVDKE